MTGHSLLSVSFILSCICPSHLHVQAFALPVCRCICLRAASPIQLSHNPLYYSSFIYPFRVFYCFSLIPSTLLSCVKHVTWHTNTSHNILSYCYTALRTTAGHKMTELPLEPQMAKMLLISPEYDCSNEVSYSIPIPLNPIIYKLFCMLRFLACSELSVALQDIRHQHHHPSPYRSCLL